MSPIHTVGLLLSMIATDPRWSVPNELPRGWKIAEIKAAALPTFDGRVYFLAWQIRQDDRPLRVESCLAVKVSRDGRGYTLTHLYRHPGDPEPRWKVSNVHGIGRPGGPPGQWRFHYKTFDGRPGNKELYAALAPEGVDWRWDTRHGFKFVGCGVCEASWQAVTREKPRRFFGK